MSFNEKSLGNLKQFRSTSADVDPESLPILPIVESSNPLLANQRLAQQLAIDSAPGMVKVLVDTAQGRGKKIPHAVRVQAAGKVLEAAGVCGTVRQQSVRAAVGDLTSMPPVELAAFVEAGARALELRRLRAAAVDAEVITQG